MALRLFIQLTVFYALVTAGVLGIVAARLTERLHKPTLLLSFEGEFGRGSGRSTGGFHLRNALSECSSCLINYGGHHAAVGLEIQRAHEWNGRTIT